MLTILERYIAKTISYATGLVTLVVGSVLLLMMLLTEFKNIGEGDFGLSQAVMYVLMRMPTEIYQFFPMLILLGSIAGLSMLSNYRELTIMRVSGFSVRQIIYSVLSAAFLMTIIVGIIGEWLAPKLTYIAEINKDNSRNAGQAIVTTAGIWLHVDNNFIHVEQVVGQQLLKGVTRYQFDNYHRLQTIYFAKSLNNENGQWVMRDGIKTNFYPERIKSESFEKSNWDLQFNTHLLNMGVMEPNQMSLRRLAKFANYLEQNGLQSSEYRFEFWQRVFQPVASIIMIFLAIPFVLGTISTLTLGIRMVIGVMVGFMFFILNEFLGQVCVVYQVPPILAVIFPLLLYAVLGVLLTRHFVRK